MEEKEPGLLVVSNETQQAIIITMLDVKCTLYFLPLEAVWLPFQTKELEVLALRSLHLRPYNRKSLRLLYPLLVGVLVGVAYYEEVVLYE